MFCEVCHQKIVEKRSLWYLFEQSSHHICETCYIKYPLSPKIEVYPIERYVLIHLCLSPISYKHSDQAYQSYIGPVIGYYKDVRHISILIFEWMDDQLYELLDLLRIGHLLIISLYENMEYKGERQ